MFEDKISDYVEGVAAKYLTAVDAEPARSHQHEIGGLPQVGFKEWLGCPGKQDVYRFQARQIYMAADDSDPVVCDSSVTWYDCRRKVEHRGPEYRLYYHDSPVTAAIAQGDFFLIAKLHDGVLPAQDAQPFDDGGAILQGGSLLMVFTPQGSSTEHQLRLLFGLDQPHDRFRAGTLDTMDLLLPLRLMLEGLGIELKKPASHDGMWIDKLLTNFGGVTFPSTAVFSEFARQNIAKETDALGSPDATLMAWMDHEEKLFRLYERHLVQERLRTGFGENGDDVDEFISYSLAVQNRRKSRVGHAFEGHLNHLFLLHRLTFQQGRGKGNVTENNAKPDFIFPSFAAYHTPDFPADRLFILGAKTTCKDRWRQVLSEANRISCKHLITLEAAISEAQTQEMVSHRLQLVVPASIQPTYSVAQRTQLMDVAGFIRCIKRWHGEQ